MEALGFEVLHLYGTTESYGPSTYCPPSAEWAGLPTGQRYALMAVVLAAGLSAMSRNRGVWRAGSVLVLLASGFGAFVAARQSWLQWYPPEIASCGRDFYGMIETFPLKRAIPMIFKGSGDCTKIDWTFLGGSIANWSFVWFVIFGVIGIVLFARQLRRRTQRGVSAPIAA